jgi:lysophospholipase L1-like esterase
VKPVVALRIAFIGDSFVAGTGDPSHLGWVGRVSAAATARRHDVTAYNLGIRRDTSADVRARWRRQAEARLPTEHARLLAFSFGVNDVVIENGQRRVETGDTIANARAILDEAKRFAPTLFVGPPPTADRELNARIAELDRALAALCAELDVPFLPVFGTLTDLPAWRDEVAGGDGAHPAGGGYAALAALVDAWPAWRRHLP